LTGLRQITKYVLLLDLYILPERAKISFPSSPFSDLSKWMLLQHGDQIVHQKHGLYGWIILPTFAAIREILKYAGFTAVVGLRPPASWDHPDLPLGRYVRNERCMLACFCDPVDLNERARELSFPVYCADTGAVDADLAPLESGGWFTRLRRRQAMMGSARLLLWLLGRGMKVAGAALQSWAEKRRV